MTWHIAGVSFACLEPADGAFLTKAEKELQKKACVFIKGIGALCLAYAYGHRQGEYAHLGLLDAALQRNIYVKKYSKLK